MNDTLHSDGVGSSDQGHSDFEHSVRTACGSYGWNLYCTSILL